MWWVIVAPSRWTLLASAAWLTKPSSLSALRTIQLASEPPAADEDVGSKASRIALAVKTSCPAERLLHRPLSFGVHHFVRS